MAALALAAVGALMAIVLPMAGNTQWGSLALAGLLVMALGAPLIAPQDPLQPNLSRGEPTTAPPGAYDAGTADAPADLRASMCDALFGEAFRIGRHLLH